MCVHIQTIITLTSTSSSSTRGRFQKLFFPQFEKRLRAAEAAAATNCGLSTPKFEPVPTTTTNGGNNGDGEFVVDVLCAVLFCAQRSVVPCVV